MTQPPPTCGECAAPLHDDQRYCLRCGARFGAPRVDPLVALGFEPEVPAAVAAAPRDAVLAAAGGDQPLPVGRRTPSRRVTAALAAATLVLGGLAGAALGPGPDPSVAAAPAGRQVVALVVPQAAPAATTTTDAAPEPPEDEGSSDTPSASDSGDAADDDTTTSDSGAADDTPDDTSTTDTSTTKSTTTDDDTETTSTTGAGDTTTTTTPSTAGTAPAHLWVVSLPATDETTAFGPASPLADLVAQGALLSGYAPAAPSSAANEVALLGGQVPAGDCTTDVTPCVLPAGEPSLPDQVVSLNLTWRAYVEDAAQRCAATPSARVGVSLFTTLTQRGDCATTVVGPEALDADLKTIDQTPALSLVVPAAADLPTASATVHALLAKILASAAYKKDGVVVLAPDAPPPATPTAPLGALVLSPRATAGTVVATPTGPVALLRSLDQLLGLDPLGAAAQASPGALDGVLKDFPPSTPKTTTRRSP
jgi:hypothetical protein